MSKSGDIHQGSKADDLQLRVTEAAPRDVGRAVARMDPANFVLMNVQIGDIVEIIGKAKTLCRLMPAFKEARHPARIQLDGVSRTNAGVALDETVSLRKVSPEPATRLVLEPLGMPPDDRDMKYIGSLVDGLPVLKGNRIRATLFGNRYAEFAVKDTSPPGPVLIVPTTLLTVSAVDKQRSQAAPGARPRQLSYEDVGGIGPVVSRIREMVELPLRYPQLFEKLGIDAPKGVLLHGAPGTGKTLLARAVASETDAHFVHISGPEIIGKYYGESEAKLRKVFEEAQKNAPCIIFIDEIDAIAPKREDLGGEKQVERRVVAQLLTLLDGLESRGRVIVIAATNLPNLLDPALRRPGRFDREIVIPVPDAHGREQVLEIHSRGMPLGAGVDLKEIARLTHGFVGADLEALCREAAMACLRRVLPEIDFSQPSVPYEKLMELELSRADFESALREVEPSALREVFVDVPQTSWDDVGGLDEVKSLLRETIEWPSRFKDLFARADVQPPKGILLSGPPGCGKTLLAQAAASSSELSFISVKGAALLSRYVGESEGAVREVFRKARQVAPCLLFFDEIDALVPARSAGSSDSHVSDRVVGQFLTELDGIEKLNNVLVLAATNRPDMIDPALLRPGRFDIHIRVQLPDRAQRLSVLHIHTRKKPLDHDVDLERIADRTEGMTGADLMAVCEQAAMAAIRECVAQSAQGSPDMKVGARHFEASLQGAGR